MPNCKKLLFCGDSSSSSSSIEEETEDRLIIIKEIPISGNAFIIKYDSPGSPGEIIGETGMENWASEGTIWSVFFRMSKPETIGVSLRLRIPMDSQSSFKFSWADEPIDTEVNIRDAMGGEYQNVFLGRRAVTKEGYVRLNFQGLERSGATFAQVNQLLLSHEITDNEIVFNVAAEAYFGRRGPSVHLRYPVELPGENQDIEYYYNEVTVPEGGEAIGLYAMAVGFTGGYFGIQVNGPAERRVLFSIWSEFNSDDPSEIPEEYRVDLIEKGTGVFVGQFGAEGSGAQSYVKFNWHAGTTYKFLVHARPIDADNTLYTAWFKRPESEVWQLVASFRKPKVSIYLKSFYSFLENFDPELGHLERRAYYGNQWARDKAGEWHELIDATFTGDATSKAGRRDFAGGLREDGSNLFYLRHCGFFDDMVPINQSFQRVAEGKLPDVDIDDLP